METLIAIGATNQIVGRTRYDVAPEIANAPSVGGGVDPSVEAMVNLHPDLVISWESDKRQLVREKLVALGIPVFILRTQDTTDIFHGIAQHRAAHRPRFRGDRRCDVRPRDARQRPPIRQRAAGAERALRRLQRSADDRWAADVHWPIDLARRRAVDLRRRDAELAERGDGRNRATRSRHARRACWRIQNQFARSVSRRWRVGAIYAPFARVASSRFRLI